MHFENTLEHASFNVTLTKNVINLSLSMKAVKEELGLQLVHSQDVHLQLVFADQYKKDFVYAQEHIVEEVVQEVVALSDHYETACATK